MTLIVHRCLAKRPKLYKWPKTSFGTFQTYISQNATHWDVSVMHPVFSECRGGAPVRLSVLKL